MTSDTVHEEPHQVDELDEVSEVDRDRAFSRTEQVRIVGAERAADAVASRPSESGPRTDATAYETAEGAATHDRIDDRTDERTDDRTDDGWGPEDWAVPAEPQLPHWTEAPTGEIPAVLSRGEEPADDPWAALPEPTWREERHDWEQEEPLAPSLLGGAGREPSLMAEATEEERQPWSFDLDRSVGGREPVEQDEPDGLDELDGPDVREHERLEHERLEHERPEHEPLEHEPPEHERLEHLEDLADLGTGDLFGSWETPDGPEGPGGVARDVESEPVAEHLAGATRLGTGTGQGGDPGTDLGTGPGRRPGTGPDQSGEKTTASQAPGAAPTASVLSGQQRGEHATEAVARGAHRRPVGPHTVRVPAVARAGDDALSQRTGRNIPAAVVSGIVVGGLALLAFHFGTVPSMVVVAVVLTAAAVEAYAAFRRAYRPATLLGIVAVAGLLVGTYDKPFVALPVVVVLLVAATFLWHLVGVDRRADPVRSTAATLVVFCWVGVFGSYAALLLAPSLFPHRTGIAYLLGALVAAVAYDVGALVVGAWVGRHPLSAVSPGKTWEGVLGGAVAAIVFAVAVVHLVHPWTLGEAAVLGVVVAVVSPIGDLCESLVKRHLGLKDMGRMLPGHGGLLDRVDGLLFVLPATYYLVRAFGHG